MSSWASNPSGQRAESWVKAKEKVQWFWDICLATHAEAMYRKGKHSTNKGTGCTWSSEDSPAARNHQWSGWWLCWLRGWLHFKLQIGCAAWCPMCSVAPSLEPAPWRFPESSASRLSILGCKASNPQSLRQRAKNGRAMKQSNSCTIPCLTRCFASTREKAASRNFSFCCWT